MHLSKFFGTVLLLFVLMATPHMGMAKNELYEPLKRFSQILDLVESQYVEDVEREALIDGAIQGMLQKLDPHSSYMGKDDFKEMQMDTSGEFSGIGIVISLEKGQLTVVSPIEDTPAYKAGLQSGDIILEINGELTQDFTLMDAVKRIRGPIGTEVELTIIHKGERKPETVTIKRATIPLHSVKDNELEKGYVYLRLTRFRENTTDELHNAIKKYRKTLQGIILDLRNNPGGLLEESVTVSDTFLEEGKIVFTKGRIKNTRMTFNAEKQDSDVQVPVVVLINAGSASASEIVAGALKDHRRAILLGERTFGKGSVQSVIGPFSDGSGIKLTTARYFTPNGTSIQAEGIEPDIYMPFVPPQEDNGEGRMIIRERDLTRHLQNNDKEQDRKKKRDPKAQELLEKDNQLRMALQLVKNLPKFQKIQ